MRLPWAACRSTISSISSEPPLGKRPSLRMTLARSCKTHQRNRSHFNVLRMIAQRVNSPLTSSCGRLFDAVAALIGIRQEVSYETQAAMELEMSGRSSRATDGYPLEICRQDE